MSDIVKLDDYKPGSGDGGDTKDKRPVIRVKPGEISEMADQVDEIFASADIGLYKRNGGIVQIVPSPAAAANGRTTSVWRIVFAEPPRVAEEITRRMRVERFDGRRNEWVRANCPELLTKTYIARADWRGLRRLTRVVSAPTPRPDLSILQRPGYDEATGLLFEPGDERFPTIAAEPSKDDAAQALSFLLRPFESFDFVDPVDRSVFAAGLLTSISRSALDTAPLFGITSPVAGSGKTLLSDACSLISTGKIAAVLSQGHSPEEFEKRLQSVLLAGDGFICIDNCEAPLEGDLLCQMLTQTEVKIRVLGASNVVDVPSNVTVFATGNNLVPRGDMARRMLLSSLDPMTERPELREFRASPLQMIAADRGHYVAAALTVIRARHVAGWLSPRPPIGSFEKWSRVIRDSLLWLGAADPCDAFEKLRERDPKLAALKAMLDEWERAIGEEPLQLSRAIDQATETAMGEFHWPAFREALLTVAGDRGTINPVRLGRWMAQNAERIVGGRRFVKHGAHAGIVRWRLELVER